MSTHAYVMYKDNETNVTKGIYVHGDGYYSWTGAILNDDYKDESKVKELISLGDLSVLDKNIGVKIDFNDYKTREENQQCRAYHRDRDEDLNIYTVPNVDDMTKEYSFCYLYDNGWKTFYKNEWRPLDEVLAKEGITK